MEGTPSTACWTPESSGGFQQRVLLFGSVHFEDCEGQSSFTALGQLYAHGRARIREKMLEHQDRRHDLRQHDLRQHDVKQNCVKQRVLNNYFINLGGGTSSHKH